MQASRMARLIAVSYDSRVVFIFTADVNYAVKDVTEGAEYEFRVLAINESGAGDPSPPSAIVCAKNPNSKLFISTSVNIKILIWGGDNVFVLPSQ